MAEYMCCKHCKLPHMCEEATRPNKHLAPCGYNKCKAGRKRSRKETNERQR